MRFIVSTILISCTLSGSASAGASDTALTYQGELQLNGNPANGSFKMIFTLWDAVSGGKQFGQTNALYQVPVVDGRFVVELDFDGSAFDNSARWLDIEVDGVSLSPRQPITRAPYAIQTRGIVVDYEHNVGIGTSAPGAKLHVAGVPGVDGIMFPDGTLQTTAVGPGGGPWSVNGTDISYNNGNVGIGTATPQVPLEVVTNEPSSAIIGRAAQGSGLSTGISGNNFSTEGTGVLGGAWATEGITNGVHGLSSSPTGRGVFGVGTSTSGGNIGVRGHTFSTEGFGVVGTAFATTGTSIGVWGESESPTGYDFFAAGAGKNYGTGSSIRWKSNVRNIDQPLEKIARLRGVYFDWDQEHGGRHDVGMIAEEVGAVLPEIVVYEKNGIDAHGMDYSMLTPLLVEAVNALRAEKDGEIANLKQRFRDLELLVERLAAKGRETSK